MTAAVPVNSLLRHVEPLADRLAQAAGQVIRSGYFVMGPHLREFEQSFAAYCGVAHCVGVANGTDALEIGLKALAIGPGDRVALVGAVEGDPARAALFSGEDIAHLSRSAISAREMIKRMISLVPSKI